MDIRIRSAKSALWCIVISSLFECCVGFAHPRAAFGPDQETPAMAKHISDIEIYRGTSFLNSLVQIGEAGNTCIGVVLNRRSSLPIEATPFKDQNTTVRRALEKLLKAATEFGAREDQGCVVVEPVRNDPAYLPTMIPSFRIDRISLDIASYYLFQSLSATQFQPAQKGAQGIAGSIAGNTNAPQVGPLHLTGSSVGKILSKLATMAGSTMWIAIPRKPGTGEPWRFIWYTESQGVINTKLRSLTDSLPD